ncbi:MAG: dipicolinate synthase subunit B [Ruminococcaceae bacterium]|nr:dipicolinate synthase subunit B [Oscillospiraceae bacterium]
MKLLFAMCGSFCTHSTAIETLKRLVPDNVIIPALSEICQNTDTRFGRADTLKQNLTGITGNEPVTSVKSAEAIVTKGNFDAVIVAPCTGNTLAKIAHGITDSTVTMCVKAQLRNQKPVVLAIATNDGLGASLKNVATALEKKNIYFVPFGQDAPFEKPTSLISDFSLLEDTLLGALSGKQIQPILLK